MDRLVDPKIIDKMLATKTIFNHTIDSVSLYKLKPNSIKKVAAWCQVRRTKHFVKFQSLIRSITKSWHGSYRCSKCINIGRVLSEAHKEKTRKANTGKPLSEQRKSNISKSLIGKYAGSKNYFYGKRFTGEACHNWKGGKEVKGYMRDYDYLKLLEVARLNGNKTTLVFGSDLDSMERGI